MKMNALILSHFNPSGGVFDSFAADEATADGIRKLAVILDELEPQGDDHFHSVWVSAPRPTFRQYYSYYYEYDCPFRHADEGTVREATDEYKEAFPATKVWFRVALKHFTQREDEEFYALFINHRCIFTINDCNSKSVYNGEDLLRWAISGAESFVTAVKDGTIEKLLRKIPYSYRNGTIKRSDYWEIVPSAKKEFLADYKKTDVENFLTCFSEGGIAGTPMPKMTARQFYEACAVIYKAVGRTMKSSYRFKETASEKEYYGNDVPTPRELYYANADGRDNGLKNLPLDDAEAFELWIREKGPYYEFNGAHPWEIITSFSISLSMHLFPKKRADGSYYFLLSGESVVRAPETVIAANALFAAGYPVKVADFEKIKNRLEGTDFLSVIPEGEKDFCDDCIHLPTGAAGDAIAKKTNWETEIYRMKA